MLAARFHDMGHTYASALLASVLVAGGVSVAATSCLGDNPADLLGDTYLMPTTTVLGRNRGGLRSAS